MLHRLCCLVGAVSVSWLFAINFAAADWRDEVEVLRVGVSAPRGTAYRVTILEPFRTYLQEKTGLPVEVVAVEGYPELIEAQTSGEINYGIYSATSFATALVSCECVEAIAAPVADDGALGFHAILVARTDSEIKSLDDARGKSIALTGPDSVAGRQIPMQAFAADGIVPRQYFLRIATEPDPRTAILALLAGDVDVAVGWSSLTGRALTGYDFGVLTRMVADGDLSMGQVRIIWRSPLIPFGPHAVSADLPPELKQILAQAMRSIATERPLALDAVDRNGFGGGGFTTPDSSLYSIVVDLVRPETDSSQ